MLKAGVETFTTSDSLFARKLYAEAAIEYERIVFLEPRGSDVARALLSKAYCRKEQGLYRDVVQTLERVEAGSLTDSLFYLIQKEKALCNYLYGQYFSAENDLLQLFHRLEENKYHRELQYLQILVLNGQEKWEDARSQFQSYLERKGLSGDHLTVYDFLRDKKFYKSRRKARLLSGLFPGAGQLYAGKGLRGLSSIILVSTTVFYTVNSILTGYYVTALFTGAPFFVTFYGGGQRHAVFLVEQYNERRKLEINQLLLEKILTLEQSAMK